MLETYRGVVNTWECDENGHMNVRHYVAKAIDGISSVGIAIGLGPEALRDQGTLLAPVEQHMRFHAETHPGTPLSLHGGVLDVDTRGMDVYQELRDTRTDKLSATITTRVALCGLNSRAVRDMPAASLQAAQQHRVSMTKQGMPRGIRLDAPRPAPRLADAEQLGLFPIYRGRVRPEDCDRFGFMHTESFMGRISDGIAQFFGHLDGLQREQGSDRGGAALEYRLVYRHTPREGDVLVVRSGLKAQQGKITQFCHWVFNAETGRCVATSEAIAVQFDLKTRTSVAPPPEAVERLQGIAIADLSA